MVILVVSGPEDSNYVEFALGLLRRPWREWLPPVRVHMMPWNEQIFSVH